MTQRADDNDKPTIFIVPEEIPDACDCVMKIRINAMKPLDHIELHLCLDEKGSSI